MRVQMYRVVFIEGRRRMITAPLTYYAVIGRLITTDSAMGNTRSEMNSGANATWPGFHGKAAREERGPISPLNI